MRLSEYMIDSAKENLDVNNIEDKVKFIQNIKNLSGKLPDGIFKKLFIQEIKKISQINLKEDLKENKLEKINVDNKSVNLSKIDSVVLSTLLKFPELSENLEEYITELTLSPKIKEMIYLIPKYKNKDSYILNKFLGKELDYSTFEYKKRHNLETNIPTNIVKIYDKLYDKIRKNSQNSQ